MCLVVVKGTNKRVAKVDIFVYKCLDYFYGNFCTPYCTPFYFFPIFFENGEYVLKVKNFTYNKSSNNKRVEEGIHSYYNKSAAQKLEKDGIEKHYAIIPKGAKYYIGNNGDVVSTELIVFETEEHYKKYVEKSEKICIIDEKSLSLQKI